MEPVYPASTMAFENDENRAPLCVKTHNTYSQHGVKPNKNPCSRLYVSTTASNSSTCLGILQPHTSFDFLDDKLIAAQQQLREEQRMSVHLQSQLQQAQRKLHVQKQQVAEITAREADLQQQLTAKDKLLQRVQAAAAAAEAAREKAAVDCNNSAGIALRRMEEVQQLQQVVQQQARQISTMQQQLHEIAVQLGFSRKLQTHTAALLSVREMQLTEAIQNQKQSSERQAGARASTPVIQPQQKEQEQQHKAQCHGVPAEVPKLVGQITHKHEDVSSAAAVVQQLKCSYTDDRGSSNSVQLDMQEEHGDSEEQGTSTPVASHPARPTRPALITSRCKSRLCLAEQFEAAAVATAADDLCSSDAAAHIVDCDQQGKKVAAGISHIGASSRMTTADSKVGTARRCKWLKRLVSHRKLLG